MINQFIVSWNNELNESSEQCDWNSRHHGTEAIFNVISKSCSFPATTRQSVCCVYTTTTVLKHSKDTECPADTEAPHLDSTVASWTAGRLQVPDTFILLRTFLRYFQTHFKGALCGFGEDDFNQKRKIFHQPIFHLVDIANIKIWSLYFFSKSSYCYSGIAGKFCQVRYSLHLQWLV